MAHEALGRGLGALFEGTDVAGDAALMHLPIAQIQPNPYQPRQRFDPQRLQQLADSIKQQGLIQPIVVRRRQASFELVAGERRLRAAQMAGFEVIPAFVKKATDRDMVELALLENVQREDLNPMEEARAYRRLQSEFHLRQEDIAQRIGKDRSTVANVMRLLQLPPSVQEDVELGRLSMGHARAILGLETAQDQQRLRDQVIAESLSVRATEERVRRWKHPPAEVPAKSSHLEALEAALQRHLGTRVAIRPGRRRGKIEITYQSEHELQRLLRLLQGS